MRFRGGVHPAYHKTTAAAPVVAMPLVARYVVPLSQHLGAPGEPIVAKGQAVARGEPLSRPHGFVSVPVHAPTSGTVTAVADRPHPAGRPQPAVEIAPDGADRWWEGCATRGDWRTLEPAALRAAIRDAGVVGMGGAAFPTHVKLSPPPEKPVDLLVVNGAECEPYLTSDHRVMVEQASDVMEGVRLLMRALGVRRAVVGVEDNKNDARRALVAARPAGCEVVCAKLETKYPQGSEKHLIKALTGREVPPGGLPMDVGVVVQNVATAAACLAAVRDGRPLTERVVTVTGGAVVRPANVLVRVGTSLADVLDFCGGLRPDAARLVAGGPMMGMVQPDPAAPVLKGTSGLLALRRDEIALYTGGPCIRCGACVDACPMALVPAALGLLVERRRWDDLGDHHVSDCIECGSCAWACPAHRPLVQYVKRGKLEWRAAQQRRAAPTA